MIHFLTKQKINLRFQICEKCFQHSNNHVNDNIKTINTNSKINKDKKRLANNISMTQQGQPQDQLQQKSQIKKIHFNFNEFNNNHFQEEYLEFYQKIETFANRHFADDFNIQKNVPFHYLKKLPASKISTKRFLNQQNNKVVEFPRKNSFQIYFNHVFLFSKLQTKQFPNIQILTELIQCLHQSYMTDSLLQKLSQFHHRELQWKENTLKVSLYQYLYSISVQTEPTKQNLVNILRDILNGKIFIQISQFDKKKIIPYTFYGSAQKFTKLQSIYLSKETRQNYRINLNFTKGHNQKVSHNKSQKKQNQSCRPWSSKLGYTRKPITKGKPQSIFSLIKRQNIFNVDSNLNVHENETKRPKSMLLDKKIKNQLQKAVNIDQKKESKKTVQQKLYVNKNFHVLNNEIESECGTSLMTNTFNSFDSKQNMKVSLLKNLRRTSALQNKQQNKNILMQPKLLNITQKSQKKQDSYNHRASIRSHRKSYFLDQKMANLISNEVNQQKQQNNDNKDSNKSNNDNQSFSIESMNFQNIKSQKKLLQQQKQKGIASQQNKISDEIDQKNDENNPQQEKIKISPPNSANNLLRKRSLSRKSSIFSNALQLQLKQFQLQKGQIGVQTSQLQLQLNPLLQKKQIQTFNNTLNNQLQNKNKRISMDLMQQSFSKKKKQNQYHSFYQNNQNGSAKAFYDKMHPQVQYREALITKKFCQIKNYELKLANNAFKLPNYHHCFDFSITCPEQHVQYKLKCIKDVYSQNDFCLFPQIFKQIKNYSTTLAQVVNILLKFNPLTIIRLFNNNSIIHPAGLYSVWLYHNQINIFKPVFINDELPFIQVQTSKQNYTQSFKPIYGELQCQNSIWFMILEKAIAKIVGGYFQLSQLASGDLFRILTGSPVVNLKNYTPSKLKKMLKQKIFQNKKAYVYALTDKNNPNLKLDRIVGVNIDQMNRKSSYIEFQGQLTSQKKITMQKFIQSYSQICLLFFSVNYFYNQICLPVCNKKSQLLNLYLINQNTQKNGLFITLGGFNANDSKSKISIYREVQNDQNPQLQNLQITDPLTFYESKYEYVGQIAQNGNYFFQTKLSYGKFLCLIQSKFQVNAKYYVSIYSEKQIKIDDPAHHQQFVSDSSTGIQKLMQSNLMKKKTKKVQNFPDQILTRRFSKESEQNEQTNIKDILKRNKLKAAECSSSQDSNKQNFFDKKSPSVANWMKQRKFRDQNFEKRQLKKMQFDRQQVHKMKQKRKKQKQKKQAQLQQMKNQKKHMLLNIITKISSPVDKDQITKKKKIKKSVRIQQQQEEEQVQIQV